MPHTSQRSLPESAEELRREVHRVRRRARTILLVRAFLAAVAADLAYDLLSLALFVITGARTYFPPFFFVAFAVFSLYALRKTSLMTISRSLDHEHHLKDRLVSAIFYRTSAAVSTPMLAAQAAESLDAIDFHRLRQSFRFRPRFSLATIILLAGIMAAIMARYPDHFTPKNIVFRQAGLVADIFRPQELPPGHPEMVLQQNVVIQGTGVPLETPGDTGEEAAEENPKVSAEEPVPEAEDEAGKAEEKPAETEKSRKPSREETPPQEAADAPASQERKRVARTVASEQGGDVAKAPAIEATHRPSPLAEKPYRGIAPEPLGFTPGDTRNYIPPIPLFKLLMGEAERDGLVDPEAITIVPEAYQEKYREHIIAYFEKLQSLREEHHGP